MVRQRTYQSVHSSSPADVQYTNKSKITYELITEMVSEKKAAQFRFLLNDIQTNVVY